MRMIGRKEEVERLRICERSGKSELVLVYGRRRVGKTFLVEQTFADTFAFRATGVESGNLRVQLKSFHERLRSYGDVAKRIPTNWFEAFSRLETLLSSGQVRRSPNGKRIVFFDEFPWFATAKSDFLMAFGEFWNRCGTVYGDILLIICGSATSWIIGNILENTGSLYSRITCQIFLSPFTLLETERLLTDRGFGWSRNQIAECQMVFGGLPYYLELLNANESLSQNIDYLCLKPHAILRQESQKILESTLRKSPIYDKILALLAGHKYGMRKAECCEQLHLPQGSFSRAVDALCKCGYVLEYKGQHEKNNPLYIQLVDPFLLFHYHFLSEANGQGVESFYDFRAEEGRYHNWRGNAFEILCLHQIRTIKASLGILGVRTKHFPWSSERKTGGAQIDLVIERDDGITNICEEKYTDKPFSISSEYERNLLNKLEVYREESHTKAALKIILISAEGVAGTAHTEHIARVLTLDDLF